MIVEQAFFALPEFLVGTGFTRYEAEGTLVMAYAMAILQELNGRNVSNPIARISGEKTYPDAPSRTADLYVEYGSAGTHNGALAKFGIHRTSWLEAKFFRKKAEKPTLDATSATYALLRDLIRLAIFPPLEIGQALSCGRYLLHAYQGIPSEHLALQRNVGGGGGRVSRGWLDGIHLPGGHVLNFGDLVGEPTEFDRQVGEQLRKLRAKATVTTFALGDNTSEYNLYLTRLDSFSMELGDAKLEASSTSSIGSWEKLVADIDSNLAK